MTIAKPFCLRETISIYNLRMNNSLNLNIFNPIFGRSRIFTFCVRLFYLIYLLNTQFWINNFVWKPCQHVTFRGHNDPYMVCRELLIVFLNASPTIKIITVTNDDSSKNECYLTFRKAVIFSNFLCWNDLYPLTIYVNRPKLLYGLSTLFISSFMWNSWFIIVFF